MKILFLSDDFPPNSRGGAEINAFNLAQVMRAGHAVFVIAATQDKKQIGWQEYEGLKIYRIYSNYHRFFTHYIAVYNPFIAREVERIMRDIRPDIIHAHNIHAHISFYSLKLARCYARGVFLSAHDTMLVSYGKFDSFIDKNNLAAQKDFNYRLNIWDHLRIARKRYNPLRNIAIRCYLKYVDKIFANTGVLKLVLEDNGVNNIEVAHYGTDIGDAVSEAAANILRTRFKITGKKIILFGGRLSREKGGEVAVRALSNVMRTVPNAVLLVAGRQDDYARYMTQLAEGIGIKRSVIFAGWLDREAMAAAYAIADIVITPSIYFDAFNLFNLEAMAAGKPVVGTCFGGTPEVIRDGMTGFVVNPFNIEILSEKIAFLLNDPDTARKMGEAGRKRASEKFSMEKQATQMLGWYQKFL